MILYLISRYSLLSVSGLYQLYFIFLMSHVFSVSVRYVTTWSTYRFLISKNVLVCRPEVKGQLRNVVVNRRIIIQGFPSRNQNACYPFTQSYRLIHASLL
jgi:hypothetical protein